MESIEETLTRDHDALNDILVELTSQVRQRSPDAGDLLGRLSLGLVRHMDFEETILFPVMRVAKGYSHRGFESLEIDHMRLRRTMEEIRSFLAREDFEGAELEVENLRIYLEGHNRDEEYGIYTAADSVLPEKEQRRLLDLWRSVTSREENSCEHPWG